MQVLIKSLRPCMAFRTKCGSAKKGLAILTISDSPAASIPSATSGMLMRFVVHRGMPTEPLSFLVTQVNAPRGTIVAIVGTRASCQPIPVLIILAPLEDRVRYSGESGGTTYQEKSKSGQQVTIFMYSLFNYKDFTCPRFSLRGVPLLPRTIHLRPGPTWTVYR